MTLSLARAVRFAGRPQAGFTLIELMIAIVISLIVILALVQVFANASRNGKEMAAVNGIIESGRFATDLIEADVVHAGFWGGYIPQYDDINVTAVPTDVPAGVPNPCQSFATWNQQYRTDLIGITVQADTVVPAPGGGCVGAFPGLLAGNDVLVVRHLENCTPGVGNCPALVAGRAYFDKPFCLAQRQAKAPDIVMATVSTLQFANSWSAVNGIFVGATVRTTAGIGGGQTRLITAYDGATRTATVTPDWTVLPDPNNIVVANRTVFSFDYRLGTGAGPMLQSSVGAAACVTPAVQRRLVSHIYYVANFPRVDRPAENIPTLVRSDFDFVGGVLAHQAPVRLIEGIERFRVEIGIDDTMSRCALANPVNYAVAPTLIDPVTCAVNANATNNTLRTNRGDGSPDRYKHCNTPGGAGAACTAAELTNAVAVKLYLLVRSNDQTPGYTDTKTYCVGETANDGSCPALTNLVAAANDRYKRHTFTSTVRMVNVSGRRETAEQNPP
ncbi:MAG TPA: PilW family protein [Solimonas sp.]|nr:PilW family protein [Solimonas sp.]